MLYVQKSSDQNKIKKEIPVSGIALSSMLHYQYLKTNRKVDGYEDEGNIEFLKSNRIYTKIVPTSLLDLKEKVSSNDITCRLI